MSRYTEKLQEILNNAGSKKITERRKCVTDLLALYDNDEAVREIHKNSEEEVQGAANWTYILHALHKILLNEAEKYATKDNSNKTVSDRKNTCSVIFKTVQNANGFKLPLLNYSDIMPLIFQVLEKRIYGFYHETYIAILVTYILPVRAYQVEMTLEQWKELLKICKKLYANESTYTNKHILLDALQMIAEYGCLHSGLLLDVRRMIPFLEMVFLDVKANQEVLAKPAYKLAYTISERIAIEGRIALCQLSESILPNIISLNSSIEKYKLLLLFVQIHHPKGISTIPNGAYAHDWRKWNSILKSTYLMVLKDFKQEIHSDSFIGLGCEVFKQILENPDFILGLTPLDESYLQPIKRRRITTKIEGPIDMITDNTEEFWSTIQILTELFAKYPESLKVEDYEAFLKILIELFTKSLKEQDVMDSLYKLAAVLLKNEKIYSPIYIQNSNEYWNKIWDILLRSLTMNQNEVSGHTLAQLFIESKKMINSNALLRLYLTNVMKWSSMSIRTLMTFCEHIPLPADVTIFNINLCSQTAPSNSVRYFLLKWALNIPWQRISMDMSVEELCSLLVSIVLKSAYRAKMSRAEENVDNLCNCLERRKTLLTSDLTFRGYIEHYHLLLSYKTDLFVEDQMDASQREMKAGDNALHMQDVLACLMEDMSDDTKDDAESEDPCVIIMKIAVLGKLASILIELNLMPSDTDKSPFICRIKRYLEIVSTLIADLDPERCKFTYLCNVTHSLNVLYGTSYNALIATVIVTSSKIEMLKNVFSLMNVEDSDISDYSTAKNYYYDYTAYQDRRKHSDGSLTNTEYCSFCNKGIIRIQATKSLTLFSSLYVGRRKLEIQVSLMKRLLQIDMYDLAHTVDFKMAMTVLESLTKNDYQELWRNHEEAPVEVLKELYKQCFKDGTAVRYILNVLPHFINYATELKCELGDLMQIAFDCHERLCVKKCGFMLHLQLIKCFSKIVQTHSSLLWQTWNNRSGSSKITIAEALQQYLRSPLCIVRLQAVEFMQHVYRLKTIDIRWKEIFFDDLTKTVYELFVINGELEEFEKLDERETRVACAMLTLTAVICNNGALQCCALLTMLRLATDKEIEIETIKKALYIIESQINYKDLIEDNITYLLSHWLNSEHSEEPFPWSLTQCDSEREFCSTYADAVVSIKLQKSETASAIHFCNDIGVPFERIVENIFPEILSCLLRYVSDECETNNKRRASKIFHQLMTNRNEFARVKAFPDLLNDKFEEIIMHLIKRLHDEDYLKEVLEVRASLPKTDPPHLKKEQLDKCIRYMEDNMLRQKKTLPCILACNSPDTLQRILLCLISRVYKRRFLEHKLKAFHQYVYFSAMILQEIKQDYFDSLSMFLVREVGYSLLNLMKEDCYVLAELACQYFYSFVKRVLPQRSPEVAEILNFSVRTLIPIVQSEKMPTALKVLEFLIIYQKDTLCSSIGKLNAFPDEPAFQRIRSVHNELKYKTEKAYPLEREIGHFLSAPLGINANCSVEDISYLRLQLSTRKEELQKMYKNLENLRGFAEDCASSVLHQLVYSLIKLCASADMKISVEALKTLGELGPVDLTTMILYLGKSYTREALSMMETLSYKMANLMTEYLVDRNIELRKASAGALYVVLSSCWGQKLSNEKHMADLKDVLGESQMTLRFDYIRPFISSQKSKVSDIDINQANINATFNSTNNLWTEESNESYQKWIVGITGSITDCFIGFFTEEVVAVCTLSTDFCELILPRMIYMIIHIESKFTAAVCKCINRFFEFHFNTVKEANGPCCSLRRIAPCDRRIVNAMLNIVNYIRIQCTDSISLKLNYMCIAKAAQYCSAFFTAILYAEIACENLLPDNHSFTSMPKIDYICEFEPERGRIIQDILRDAYLKIGDPDAIYGCGSSYLLNYSSRIQYYIHTDKWDKVVVAQDVELSSGNSLVIREMANGLHYSGLQYLLGQFMNTMSKNNVQIDEDLQYECAWRLSNWGLCDANHTSHIEMECDPSSEVAKYNYHFYHYQALKCFYENNEFGVQKAVEKARLCIAKDLRTINLESSKTIYEKLMQLQLLREIEELNSSKLDEYVEIFQSWQKHDIGNSNEFLYIEPILTQRTVMYRIKDSLNNNSDIKEELANTYLRIAQIAADQDHLNVAARALALLAKQQGLSPENYDKLLYHESLLAWMTKDLEIGRFLLRTLINKVSLKPSIRAEVLRVYGDWMAETKSENPQAVIKKYYLSSIDISNSIKRRDADAVENLHDTQVALARFADTQFQQISAYMSSPQFESLKECVEYSGKSINVEPSPKDVDVRRAVIINQKQNTNDVAELEQIENEKNNYLILALRYYLLTLQQSEKYNLLIFRVAALWLDNKQRGEVRTELNDLLGANLFKIASFKFIPLVPQLAAHMSITDDEFAVKIRKIMERCALEHPHHTLPVLLALKNLYGDLDYNTIKSKPKVNVEARVLAAKKLLDRLGTSKVGCIVREMDKLSHALVMLANLEVSSSKPGCTHRIPANQEIVKIGDFKSTLLMTLTINVQPSGNYENIISIFNYLPIFETVGGVNAPKKIICLGTDGIKRQQLVKGKDDLRQDAVMQQVFNVMNTLLKACKETNRQKLIVRTYKIVPLTQRSGILEWCDNTTPILSILIGSASMPRLHTKYYPKDYTVNVCKDKMAAVVKASSDVKLKVFMDCCSHMHPALHHFFLEKYPSPETWFERRSAYTRSVATTSMVGYILGLGDRHLSNILIDQTTAEVIHIDFGIAFEQGKLLPIPETVPFRLTRNIEAAMGVSGIEGVMRRSCEKTLSVLRDQKQIIITLLQVLLYDPLFTWAITPAKAHDIQSGRCSRSTVSNQGIIETNKTAERALLRTEQKLQGTEEGVASSVPGQVERLIQEARDPTNLCRLYCGWQPYL